jgi:bacterioferritin-associated ferredoxin
MDEWLDLARMARYLDQSVARDTPSAPASKAQIGRDMDALWRDLDESTRAVLARPEALRADPHMALAQARRQEGDPVAALEELRTAVAARPACGTCRRELALALEAVGETREAREQKALARLVGGGRKAGR